MKKAIITMRKRYEWLNNKIAAIEKTQERYDDEINNKTIVVWKHNSIIKYYIRDKSTHSNGKYLPKKQISLAKRIAQKEYDKKYLKIAKHERDVLRDFLGRIKQNENEECYSKMSEGRKALIKAHEMSDEDYAKMWLSIPYERKPFSEDAPEFYTNRGERVRSKSEIIIADMLDKYNIPYKYECPLIVNGKTIHPDFTILIPSQRKVMYWEHLGMLGDLDYLTNALRRNNDYQTSGYFPGTEIIYSYETTYMKLSIKQIDNLIKKYIIID